MLRAFSDAFGTLRRHPFMFLLLLGVEALFFILLGMLLYSFTTSLLSSMESIDSLLMAQPWATENPTAENLGALNIPGTDLIKIQQEQSAIAGAARSLALWGAVLFIVSRALSYTLSSSFVRRRGLKELTAQFGKSFFAGSILVGMVLFLGWKLIPEAMTYFSAIQPIQPQPLAFPAIAALGLLALLYAFPLALAFAQLASLKELAPAVLRFCFFSFFRIVGCYVLIVLLMAIPASLLFFYFEYSWVLAVILMIGLLSALVYGRLVVMYLVSGITQLESQHSSESRESMVRTKRLSGKTKKRAGKKNG